MVILPVKLCLEPDIRELIRKFQANEPLTIEEHRLLHNVLSGKSVEKQPETSIESPENGQ
jgi:hypothetical protein